jgi:hypothetical protein
MYEQAQRARGLSNDELFEVVCASLIESVESAVHLKEARASRDSTISPAPDTPAKRRTRSSRGATARKPAAAPARSRRDASSRSGRAD